MPVRVEINAVTDAAWAVDRVERGVRGTLEDQGVTDAQVSVTLLDDARIAELNARWKGREAPTDVLAFPLQDEGEPPLGDIYLGVDQIARQAAELDEEPERELERVIIHGTLHVLGWDHPEEGRESSAMWAHQERILERLAGG